MIRLDQLFDVIYGVNLDLSKLTKDDNGINYVGRSKKNNGITAKVLKKESILPNPANTISVSAGGSVMEAFVQEEEYYSGRDLYYLKPKIKMSIAEMQYYCMCIRANQFKYSFGRQANMTLASIMVPNIDEIPAWVYKKRDINVNSIPDYFLDEGYDQACWYLDHVDQVSFENEYSKSVITEKVELDYSKWRYFKLCGAEGIFNVEHGTRLKSVDRIDGDIPLVTAGKINQGVATYIQENQKMKIFENCITIDMFGNSFYHPEKFYCDDNIVTLMPKKYISEYCCQFISIVLNNEKYRYSFGRQYRKTKYSDNQMIFLPSICDNGEYVPDFKYMEEFIKSLSYSYAV